MPNLIIFFYHTDIHWTCLHKHTHTPVWPLRASPTLSLSLSLLGHNQIVFNWTHGVCGAVSPEISPHSLSFIPTGCFPHASQCCFGLSSDNVFFSFIQTTFAELWGGTAFLWIMVMTCLISLVVFIQCAGTPATESAARRRPTNAARRWVGHIALPQNNVPWH